MEQYKETVLLPLYYQYSEHRGTDGPQVQQKYEKIYRLLDGFSFAKRDALECAVNELCGTADRIAFLDGVRIGARLMRELTGEWE